MDFSHQILTAGSPFEEETIELFSTCVSEVITMQSRKFGKSLYLQLCISYDHQIWTAGTPTGEKPIEIRHVVQNSKEISSRVLKPTFSCLNLLEFELV